MKSDMNAIGLTTRLFRIVFLVFLSQQFPFDKSTKISTSVDAAYFDFQNSNNIDSCKNHGIYAGETLEEDCINYCRPNPSRTWDAVDLTENLNFAIRNTVCRCYEYGSSPSSPETMTFECWSKAEVWDKRKPVMKCEEDYGIVSLTTCQDFCKSIDPKAMKYDGFAGNSRCWCGGFKVCSDSPSVTSAAPTNWDITSIIATLVAAQVWALWS